MWPQFSRLLANFLTLFGETYLGKYILRYLVRRRTCVCTLLCRSRICIVFQIKHAFLTTSIVDSVVVVVVLVLVDVLKMRTVSSRNVNLVLLSSC